MISNLLRRIALVSTALVLVAVAGAQSPAPKTIRFRTLSWADPVEGVFYEAKGKPTPITAQSWGRSDFYQAEAAEKVVFFKQAKGSDGRMVRTVVAEAALEGKSGLLLFLFSKQPNGQLRVNVAEDDTTQFPAGSYRFVNLSSSSLMVAAGSARALIAPGESKVLTSRPDEATHGVNVRLATAAGEASQMIYADVWLWSADARTLVYASDTGNPQVPVDLKRITENARFDKDPAPAAPAPAR
jgi:hypothetical protein